MFGIFFIFLTLTSSSVYASLPQIEAEYRYRDFVKNLTEGKLKPLITLDSDDRRILIDALWDIEEEGTHDVRSALQQVTPEFFSLPEQLRLAVLAYRAGTQADLSALSTLILASVQTDEILGLQILSLKHELRKMGLEDLVAASKKHFPGIDNLISLSDKSIGDQTNLAYDLWNYQPDSSLDASKSGTKLYMFCRTNRSYPCIFTLRDKHFKAVTLPNGDLWTQPALAYSARGLPYHQRNGNTPAGIHQIEGVMPTADQTLLFGKFRRLILGFIPPSPNESELISLLPPSSHDTTWWRQSVVARDIGRNLMRIHGSGRENKDTTAQWFPLMRTNGCVSQRENKYNGVEYRDQDNLLKTLMRAQGLEVKRENELKIKGILYLIELNNEARPVTISDLEKIGIRG
jgi:hypothetical protein